MSREELKAELLAMGFSDNAATIVASRYSLGYKEVVLAYLKWKGKPDTSETIEVEEVNMRVK